jgi:hypothetical protein
VLSISFTDTTRARPDSHAPICVMGEHGHKTGEMMLAYRFMTMDMRSLQSGTDTVETADVLKDFMMAPTAMNMRMHMFGVMFAPHDKITLMAMASYQQRSMEMEGAHLHATGHHNRPVGTHKMSSAGIGDVKLDSLLTLWKRHNFTFLGNVGVSFPTGSITQQADDGSILPYPMQLGSGSFEALSGTTFFGTHGNWSYGGQLRGTFPLNTNASEYRQGNTLTATTWGARRVNNWISLSARLLFSHKGSITGNHPDLDLNRSPSHRPDFRGFNRLDIAISSNLIVPTGSLVGQRLAIEFMLPVYQHLTGTQLKNTWKLVLGWQYAFRLL